MRKYRKAIAALVWTKPVKFLRALFSKKTLNSVIEQLYDPNQSDELKAFSAAFGIFIGIIPVWGLQTIMAIFFSILLKLNKSLVVIFSQVSFPPVFPVIIFLSYKTGKLLTDGHGAMGGRVAQYLFGSITLAIAAGLATGVLTYAWLKLAKAIRQYRVTARLKNRANKLTPA
ncbi:MAG TPA: DUF2062 domain-containing protein [Mucilaginibacter sp.]|nr:DUF2062 domain-containing protein [Mucilaginibacter sp.]